MPSTIYTPEFPAVTGLLDEDALVVGHFPDAHVLRSIGNASNRLAARGNYLVHEVFRRAGNDEQIGTTGFYVHANWQRIRAFPACERKAHLARADVRIRARITSGASIVYQLQTGAVPWREDVREATTNALVAVGTGNFELYQGQIELGRSSIEDISLWAWGDPSTSPLMNTAVYGAPNSGNVNDPSVYVTRDRLIHNGVITWNTNIRQDRIVIVFFDSLGNTLLGPLPVQAFSFAGGIINALQWGYFGGTELTSDQVQAITQPGSTYQLWEAPTLRLSSVTIRERDAYAA